jgi:hypothetical protein
MGVWGEGLGLLRTLDTPAPLLPVENLGKPSTHIFSPSISVGRHPGLPGPECITDAAWQASEAHCSNQDL